MSDDAQRRSNGQFQKGVSGNRDGARRRQPAPLLTEEDMHRTIVKVASTKVVNPTTGEKITRFENWTRSLASGSKNRLALKGAIEMAKQSASYIANERRRLEREERLRKQPKQSW